MQKLMLWLRNAYKTGAGSLAQLCKLEEVNVGNTSWQPFDTMLHRQVKYQQEKVAIKYF